MNPAVRARLFIPFAVALGALLLWSFSGAPRFGAFAGRFGQMLNHRTVPERHVTDVVSAVNFDYRAFDTLGEEFILFISVVGTRLLLRPVRSERLARASDQSGDRRVTPASDAARVLGLGLIGAMVLFGIYVVTHGQLTPGGGFQGGVLLATALWLVYLAGDYETLQRLSPEPLISWAEAAGGGGYVLIGLGGMYFGGAFLNNFLPLGRVGSVFSGGIIPLISLAVGLEVSGGLVLLLRAFLEEALQVRERA